MAHPKTKSTHELDAHQVRVIAARGIVSPESVARYLRGEPTRATTTTRVEDALKALDRRDLIRRPLTG